MSCLLENSNYTSNCCNFNILYVMYMHGIGVSVFVCLHVCVNVQCMCRNTYEGWSLTLMQLSIFCFKLGVSFGKTSLPKKLRRSSCLHLPRARITATAHGVSYGDWGSELKFFGLHGKHLLTETFFWELEIYLKDILIKYLRKY